jgi:isocitrate/isopropylmalate dehydrogenase
VAALGDGGLGGVRPIRFFPGMRSPLGDPDGIDYVLLRENSEGLYPGREGDLADLVRLMPNLSDRTGRTVQQFGTEGRFAVKVVTPRGAERIGRFACDLARKRQARGKPGKVTLVTKSNVLPKTDGLYDEIVGRIVREAGLAFEHFHVDDAARRLVRFPKQMDVVLCMNLYGDILSDLGRRPRAASAWPRRATSATAGPTSSRCTAPRRTSRARASRTPPRPFSPPR